MASLWCPFLAANNSVERPPTASQAPVVTASWSSCWRVASRPLRHLRALHRYCDMLNLCCKLSVKEWGVAQQNPRCLPQAAISAAEAERLAEHLKAFDIEEVRWTAAAWRYLSPHTSSLHHLYSAVLWRVS